jgi:hypothetical protein
MINRYEVALTVAEQLFFVFIFSLVMATALGQRPKGSWPFVFNIKHPGGSQRQRYRFRTAAGCYV